LIDEVVRANNVDDEKREVKVLYDPSSSLVNAAATKIMVAIHMANNNSNKRHQTTIFLTSSKNNTRRM
jgi:hypothetical protein